MRRYFNRLISSQGETIVETLAAILIAALSCTILMTTVTAASLINRNAKATSKKLEQELLEAEIGASDPDSLDGTNSYTGTVSVDVVDASGHTLKSYSYEVIYTGGSGRMTSYQLPQEKTAASEGAGAS